MRRSGKNSHPLDGASGPPILGGGTEPRPASRSLNRGHRNAIAALALWALFSPFALLGTDSGGPLKTHLPSSVTLGAQVRYRAESTSRSDLLERYRLDVELRPAAWLGSHPDARSERVSGAGEWRNSAHAFDAVRVSIHHVVNRTDPSDHHRHGNNLHDLYGSFGSWLAGAKVEPYLLLRSGLGHGRTYGLRMAGTAGTHGSYGLESLGQRNRGSAGAAQRKRHLRDRLWQSALSGESNYAWAHLDQVYPTNHAVCGVAQPIGPRNTEPPAPASMPSTEFSPCPVSQAAPGTPMLARSSLCRQSFAFLATAVLGSSTDICILDGFSGSTAMAKQRHFARHSSSFTCRLKP